MIGHRIDPHKPVGQGGYEPIYSDDPRARPVPLINDEQRVMLERMWDDMDIFIPERGRLVSGMKAQRGVEGIDPGMGITDASSHYSHGAAGSPVSEDLRVLSGAKVSNVEYKQAIQELLDGKLPTNRKHTAALEAAQAYIERRSGFHPPTAPPRESTATVPASDLMGPPKTDTLPTGEEQPRLPGDVGDVRDVDVETPEIDLPYSLSGGVSERPQGKTSALFGPENAPEPPKVKPAASPAKADRPVRPAADIVREMGTLRQPRALKKLYGPNPTPEQVALHADAVRAYNREMGRLRREYAVALERDNAAFREKNR